MKKLGLFAVLAAVLITSGCATGKSLVSETGKAAKATGKAAKATTRFVATALRNPLSWGNEKMMICSRRNSETDSNGDPMGWSVMVGQSKNCDTGVTGVAKVFASLKKGRLARKVKKSRVGDIISLGVKATISPRGWFVLKGFQFARKVEREKTGTRGIGWTFPDVVQVDETRDSIDPTEINDAGESN